LPSIARGTICLGKNIEPGSAPHTQFRSATGPGKISSQAFRLMNRQELQTTLCIVTSELLREKGYISAVDVFMKLGYLDRKDYEAWRSRRVPCLQRVIKVNLSRISLIMRTLAAQQSQRTVKAGLDRLHVLGKGDEDPFALLKVRRGRH